MLKVNLHVNLKRARKVLIDVLYPPSKGKDIIYVACAVSRIKFLKKKKKNNILNNHCYVILLQ